MYQKITAEQFQELNHEAGFDTRKFHELLEEYTGITAVPYTAFSFFDLHGNYIGDSGNSDVRDLLRSAYIEVEQEG